MNNCEHLNFAANVNVHRIVEDEKSTDAIGYTADITIKCAECGTPFHFKGLEVGVSPREPKTSLGGLELHAPIAPGQLKEISRTIRYETFASDIIQSGENNN